MESVQVIYERIAKINWFSNCGKEMADCGIKYEQVKDWKEVVRKCKSTTWENAQLEARNALTVALHNDWQDKYRM